MFKSLVGAFPSAVQKLH